MIQQRESFLNNIAKALGRDVNMANKPELKWQYNPQSSTLINLSKNELLQLFKSQCNTIHTNYVVSKVADLKNELKHRVELNGGGPVSLWKDERFAEFGLQSLIEEEWPALNVAVNEWNPDIGAANLTQAKRSNVGITFSDMTLAETGTVVLFSNSGKGRSVSILPKTYIALIPQSTIVPRMTQAAQFISQKVKNGEAMPACINFISGPSNSADIEMNPIIGVHGPIKATYIIISDR
ncbi:LutC/YkgG family protein [Rummeliibacillus pycnus]|uniref:LutC/YkgG family protein n=1 Tax=Rummeliibacillus pycnus TaxID=101070 RepID=UPI000C9CF7B0|nr:lactate utilization protein C [Rummeliibacillus pycnus]